MKTTKVTKVSPGEKEGGWTWINYLNKDGDTKKTAIKPDELIKLFNNHKEGDYSLEWEQVGDFYEVTGAKFVGQSSAAAPNQEAKQMVGSTNKDLQIEAAVIFKGAIELSVGRAYRFDEFRRLLGELSTAYKELLSGKLVEEKKELKSVPF